MLAHYHPFYITISWQGEISMHESIVFDVVVMIMGLLFIASVVAIVSKKIKMPFTILLVIIGLIMGWAANMIPPLQPLTFFRLTPELSMTVFLPALLFESAFNLDARKLIKNIVPIMVLAIPALLLSTATVGFIIHYALSLPLSISLLFGALISATDPVAVIALFKDMGAPKRLTMLVEGESLFNDGTAVVLYKIILGVILLGHFTSTTIVEGAIDFFVVFTGGIALGIFLGVVFSKIIGFVENDRLVEITLTTILAHSTFLTAEHLFHVSGIMATVAAGITVGSYGRNKISPPVQQHMASFWEYVAFVCNSLIFLLVGLSIDIPLFMQNFYAIAWGFIAIIIARAIAVYTLFPLIAKFRRVDKVDRSFQTVIFWGGLRGSLAIAMALSIPDSLEQKPFILVMTLGVVLCTLVINGLTVKPLMSYLGLNHYSISEQFERLQALLQSRQKAWKDILSFAPMAAIDEASIEAAEKNYIRSIEGIKEELAQLKEREATSISKSETDMLMRQALMLEKVQYQRFFERGMLSEGNLKTMTHVLDNELDRIKEKRKVMGKGQEDSLFRRTEDFIFKDMGRMSLFKPLLLRYKTKKISSSYERKRVRMLAIPAVLAELEKLDEENIYSKSALNKARAFYKTILELNTKRIKALKGEYPEYVEKVERGIIKRCSLNSEFESMEELYKKGAISKKVLKSREEEIQESMRKMRMHPVEELLFKPAELLLKVPCFSELTEENMNKISHKVRAASFLPNEVIVKEGEQGNSLFIVGRGKVEVLTIDDEGKEMTLALLKAGDFFGEVALLHPQPRTATVRASTPSTLLELRRHDLMPVLQSAPHLKDALEKAYRERILKALLAHVPVFQHLGNEKRDALASEMKYSVYKPGEVISVEGEGGEYFYIIRGGEAEVIHRGKSIGILKHGDFFGEELLDKKKLYKNTVKALTELEVYSLKVKSFEAQERSARLT